MIKKVLSITLLIFLMFLIFQFSINYFKTDHYLEYTLEVGRDNYEIKETYNKRSNNDYYFIEIDSNDGKFFFTIDNKFNKQKQIVKDIKTFRDEDVFCISLVYSGSNNISSPICSKEGNLYSFVSIKDDYDFSSYLEDIKAYSKKLLEQSEDYSDYLDISVNDNLYDDETLLIYNYQTLIEYSKNEQYSLQFSSSDSYKNEFGFLVDHYYLVPDIDSGPDFSTYLSFDIKGGYNDEIELPNNISKQSYINGIYDDKLYIFDKSNKVQYSIDPNSKKVEITGDENNKAFVYQNGSDKSMSVYDLDNEKVLFSLNTSDYKDIEYDDIYVYDEFAIYSLDNNYYKVYRSHLDNPIFLFNQENVKELKIKKDRIYYIVDNFIYRYDDYGLVKLAKREEFKYNYENIYDVYVK